MRELFWGLVGAAGGLGFGILVLSIILLVRGKIAGTW